MSDPGGPMNLGGLLGGGQHVYPPAPKGFKYTATPEGLPQAPPGYKYADMKTIARGATPGARQQYVFNAHTAEGMRERANEAIRMGAGRRNMNATGNPNQPSLTQTPTSPAATPTPAPTGLPVHIPLPTARPDNTADEIQQLLTAPNARGPVPMPTPRPGAQVPMPTPRPGPKSLHDMSLEELKALGNSAFHGTSDTTQSKLDATTQKAKAVPAVLEQMMQNPTAPMGPAFNPNNANLDELKYQPLPNEEEEN